MHVKSLTLAVALALLAIPAHALTLEQAMNEVAGMHCSGSACTSKSTSSVTVQNPDILSHTEVLVSPATRQDAPNTSLQSFDHCPPMRTMNGGWTARPNVNADCTALSINPGSGGFPAVYDTVTATTPGGTTTTVTCTTTTKEMVYNGPHTARDGAWSVNTSVSSSDGAC